MSEPIEKPQPEKIPVEKELTDAERIARRKAGLKAAGLPDDMPGHNDKGEPIKQ